MLQKQKNKKIETNTNIFHIKSPVLMCTHRKLLSKIILMRKIKALALTVSKLLARFKFWKNMSNTKVKVKSSKISVPALSQKYPDEISKL